MTAPHTPPPGPAGGPDPIAVRLDVRVGSARPVGRAVPAGGFVVGGADGSDLRLPGASLPPQLCRFDPIAGGLALRRLAPAVPILLNGSPFIAPDPVVVRPGDVIAVGAADITVTAAPVAPLRPSFVPFPPAAKTVTDGTSDPLRQEREELAHLRASLEEQARELEADRVLWYRRRNEIEAEWRARTALVVPANREADLSAREQDLTRSRTELASIRQNLVEQYQSRRDELAQMQEVVRSAAAELEDRRRRFEIDLERRRGEILRQVEIDARDAEPRLAELRVGQVQLAAAFAELDAQRIALTKERAVADAERALEDDRRAERSARLDQREADLDRRETQLAGERQAFDLDRERYAADLIRLDRQRGEHGEKQQTLDRRAAEVDQRVAQLVRDSAELEETVRLADAEQSRIMAEAERLDRVRAENETRAADLADRAARLEAQQAMLAVLRAKLDRQHEDMRRETTRLAADRVRHDEARADLHAKIRDAEALRAELAAARDGHAEQEKTVAERNALLEASLKELAEQQAAITADMARLKAKEDGLDDRSAEIAEQAATLKARLEQVMDLQARLEADRAAVRDREVTLTDADTARTTFQEQLRRRAEDLAARARQFDETAARIADEEAALDRQRAEFAQDRQRAEQDAAAAQADVDAKADELGRQTAALADREAALSRQVERLREAGRAVADGRKQLAAARKQLDGDRVAAVALEQAAREEIDALRARAADQFADLKREVPALEDMAVAARDRLAAARDVLGTHLAELHAYAAQTRAELDAARAGHRADEEALHAREAALETARSEHRLAVAQFRGQLTEWHTRVAELKQAMARSESRIDARQAEVATASHTLDVTTQELARQAEELRQERQLLTERRAEVEGHLADMREWYRKKLRQLVAQKSEVGRRKADEESNPIAGRIGDVTDDDSAFRLPPSAFDVDPGDRQLGELLRSLDMVDADTLTALWAEAERQRRTLRQVLLTSGVVTLYQLAMIEAGNVDALVMGRLRVLDKVRATPREVVYRVFDPARTESPGGGVCLLRVLSEAESQDAVRPDEFRQRFAALRDAAHPNLAGTLEVLDIGGRPAVLQEWVAGLPGSEWPTSASVPGVWVRLLGEAAAGLDAAHGVGLIHGRLTSDSLTLTSTGTVKVLGVGEPVWLAVGPTRDDSTPVADLRALGQIAVGWVQAATAVRPKGRKPKPFPEPLLTVVRRLEADPDTPMGDTPAGADPYRSAAELAQDLSRLGEAYPCSPADWNALVHYAAENAADGPVPLRRSA